MGKKPFLIPPVWFLIFVVLAVTLAWQVPALRWDFPGRVVIGHVLAAAGIVIAATALIQFRRRKTTYKPEDPGKTSALVTGGIYRVTRNPMYVGMALLLLAISFWSGHLAAALLVPFFMLVLWAFQIRHEEHMLAALFGADYEAFKNRTPRWLLF
jgi:protein-S-isoprenylcysteine O-methyltransferase Ste14